MAISEHCQMLNQHSDHICIEADFATPGDDEKIAMRVTEGEEYPLGLGENLFYTLLDNPGDCTKAYIKDNTIQLPVARVVDFNQICLLERQILSSIDPKSLHTPPHPIVMTYFEQHKESGRSWKSPSFYTHHKGYRMYLQVYANGHGEGKDTHISVFTSLMCGEFDSQLKWPFRGTIIIQLVNQLEDNEHHTATIFYGERASVACSSRLTGSRG